MEYEISVAEKSNIAYLRDDILKVLGKDILATVGGRAMLAYPKDIAYDDLMASIEMIKQDMAFRRKATTPSG